MPNDLAIQQKSSLPIRLPQENEWVMMERYARAAVQSGLVQNGMKPDQAFFIILKGYELNITPIQALSDIHLINGKPGLSVQLMISLANRSGMLSHLDIPDAFEAFNTGKATVTAVRHDRPNSPISMTFTREDAEKAGLIKRNGAVWNAYMGQMLVNRAVSMVLRRIIPEALSGMYLAEELRDEMTNPQPSITVETIKQDALSVRNVNWEYIKSRFAESMNADNCARAIDSMRWMYKAGQFNADMNEDEIFNAVVTGTFGDGELLEDDDAKAFAAKDMEMPE